MKYPAKTVAMPRAWSGDGISPYRNSATRNTSAGAEARIGVAIEIGSVRSAQNVKTHDVPTIRHFIAENARTSGVYPPTAPISPLSARPATYAMQPKHVETSSVGRTAFSLTLAFFARS